MTFDSRVLLILAPVVALALGLLAWRARYSRLRRARVWSRAAGQRARSYGRAAPVVLALAGLAAGLALAGPRGGRAEVITENRSLNLVFAMDISRSMLAEDAAPNRLGRASQEARRLAQDLPGDRLGVLAFAGRSYILSPLTVDQGAVQLYLSSLDPDLASEGGTSLGSALRQARGLLSASDQGGDKILVIFTDGETLDSVAFAEQEARALNQAGIRLVLVAEGGPRPVRIPVRDSAGTLLEYKLDPSTGQPVETRRRDDILQRVAEAADGVVVSADLPDQAGAVRDLVAAFKRSPSTSSHTADLLPLAWIPALVAAIILLLQTLTRRQAALIALGGLLLGTGAGRAAAQRPAPGNQALAAGNAKNAAQLFLKDVPRAGDTAWYNAGTAALAAGDLDVARRALTQAAKSVDPALRYRALYNQGVAALQAARAAPPKQRDALYQEATQALRQALLLQPASDRAKWNLELAQRSQPPPPPQSGGTPPPNGGGGGQQEEPPPPQGGLSRKQAEQILNSVEREEAATRARHMKSGESGSSGVRDW